MKKIHYTLIFAITAMIATACNTTTSSDWSREQRKSVRRALDQYRDMVYIDELNDTQYYIFADDVTDLVETNYPDYESFVALPTMVDSIEVYATTIIVERLDADGTNIKHIYPYRELRREGILPAGMSIREQRAFYKCFARKINARYTTFAEFLQAVIADTSDKSQIADFQKDCATTIVTK